MDVIVRNGEMSVEEQAYYEKYISEKYPQMKIRRLFLSVDGDMVNISIELEKEILTKMGGALIGDPLTWNRAKRAEYFDTIPNALPL